MFQALVFWRRLKLFLIFAAVILFVTGSYQLNSDPKLNLSFNEPVTMSHYELENYLENKAIAQVESQIVVNLPKATTSPIPAPSYVLSKSLGPHQLFGFAPYWTLASEQNYPIQDYTTISYFSLSVNSDGTIDQTSSGWTGYSSQALVNLIDTAHKNGVRVVLTVSCLEQTTLEALTSSGTAPQTLANQLLPLLKAKSFDGVNFDFEGQGSGIRAGLTRLITTVSTLLKQSNPNYQVTADTYVSSAGDPNGPFDIAQLAPAVDGFFIMGYDMEDPSFPSPNSALSNWQPSDVEALQEYTQVVTPSKLILGIPFYGYQWPTDNGTEQATATGAPTPISYAQIVALHAPTYWDATANVPWTSYEQNGQWYEIYYDDPPSIAMKVALAQVYHIAGVGVWALGMDNNDPNIIAALLGGSAPYKNYVSDPPTVTSSSVNTGSNTSTSSTTTTNPCGSTSTSSTSTTMSTSTSTSLNNTSTSSSSTINSTPTSSTATSPTSTIESGVKTTEKIQCSSVNSTPTSSVTSTSTTSSISSTSTTT